MNGATARTLAQRKNLVAASGEALGAETNDATSGGSNEAIAIVIISWKPFARSLRASTSPFPPPLEPRVEGGSRKKKH